jgi:DNA-binding NarL/FixJ family response regulator
MFISEETVKAHSKHIMAKLGVVLGALSVLKLEGRPHCALVVKLGRWKY